MKGVLIKDLYIAKSNILVTLVSLVVLGFGLSFLLETSALLILAPVVSTTAVFISITSDATSKWNKNVITMPVSRSAIIGEKFIFYMLLAVLGIIAALVPCMLLAFIGAKITMYSLYLYGIIGVMMSLMASTGIIVGLVFFINIFIPVKEHILLVFSMVLAIAAVWFLISYKITAKVYQKQDIY